MGSNTDPTMKLLALLADESKWEVRRNIPVFEPHERIGVGPDGKPKKITVTAEDLPEIADQCNRLERVKGVVGRLTDRHTIRPRPDGKGMEPVPEAVLYGFQKNYRTGTYGPSNTPCVLCDWYLYPQHAAKADRSPHRSVEYQHGAKLIRGTAVMMNDPFLDMGMVVFQSESDFSFEFEEPSMLDALTATPPQHNQAVEYMLAHPGMSYERALREVPAPDPDPEPTLGVKLPWYHDRAMAYMLDNPGTTYDYACLIAKNSK